MTSKLFAAVADREPLVGQVKSLFVAEKGGVFTGIGIPEALQPSLFEKFSSASRSGVGGEASTGLGLFITKQIVQQHHSKIRVESQEGAGACFFVELHYTYLLPVIPLCFAGDGAVSNARTYTLNDLDQLLTGLETDDYHWDKGLIAGKAKKLYLLGLPQMGE